MRELLLLQLPLHQVSALSPTGNVPLAAGGLLAPAGGGSEQLCPQERSDSLGDRALLDWICSDPVPSWVGFTLYEWNAERSSHIAGELRNRIPGLRTIGGGPEVFADNHWLLENGCFDLLVSGEGERLFRDLFPGGTPSDRLPPGTGNRGPLKPVLLEAGPGEGPPPPAMAYLSGMIPLGPGDAACIETVRGCSASCSYCAYRRSSPVPRILPAAEAIEAIRALARLDPDELVFLDPTFNSRDDLDDLLAGMSGMGPSCFGEMRGELIDPGQAHRLREAGFRQVEVGLQTMTLSAIRRTGRGGDPRRALDGCRYLREAGIAPIVDLIIGLPGDTPAGMIETAEAVVRAGLGWNTQVFVLSVLPGTTLRSSAGSLGMEYMPMPPYYAGTLDGWPPGSIAATIEAVSDVLGYELARRPRPLLFDGWEGTEEFAMDDERFRQVEPPSIRHGALRISGDSLWSGRHLLREHVERRRAVDPYCVLDLVLVPASPFPLDLVEWIRDLEKPFEYTGRVAARFGHDGLLRPSVLIGMDRRQRFDPGWIHEASDLLPVCVDIPHPDSPGVRDLLAMGAGIRILAPEVDLQRLARSMAGEPEMVFFSSSLLERLWVSSILEEDIDPGPGARAPLDNLL